MNNRDQNSPITNVNAILPDAYDRACIHRGYLPQSKIRIALSKTLADSSKAQFSNLHRDLDAKSWEAVAEAFAFLAARQPSALLGRDVQMNANGASDLNSSLILQALLPSIASVEMLANSLGPASAATIGSHLSSKSSLLRRLKLGGNHFTGDNIAPLLHGVASNTMLQQLHLAENRLGDTGAGLLATALWSNATLTSLCLRDTGMTSVGIGLLVNAVVTNPFSALTEFDIKKNPVRIATAFTPLLKFSPRLTMLDVSHCGIDAKGCTGLSDALAQNQSLRFLSLSGNPIGDADMSSIFTAMCRATCAVSALSVEDCGLTGKIAPSAPAGPGARPVPPPVPHWRQPHRDGRGPCHRGGARQGDPPPPAVHPAVPHRVLRPRRGP